MAKRKTQSRRRVGPPALTWWNDVNAMEFVIWFVQAERDEAIEASQQALDFAYAPHDALGVRIEPEDLIALQAETLELLRSSAEPGSITEKVLRVPFVIMRPGSGRRPHDKARVLEVRDAMSMRELFLYRVIRFLQEGQVEKLAVCEAPPAWSRDGARCGRLFLKKTTKTCCTSKCQRRMYMRGYVERGYQGYGKATRTRRR